VETAVRRYGSKDVRWSSQGMLRLTPEAMEKLFQPTLDRIKEAVGNVVKEPAVRGQPTSSDNLHYLAGLEKNLGF